ncbi:NAD(P)-dependent alcohol dehydrogenase [Adhaeribacter pallidiroseus]|uniref:Putative cinnamyl alcohol dehydrogenase n=1 Tax=Adhaeribacter pallidiroseus TaxID=2072847 RepID=A0A369QN70_9BACT|nr:NAD(P)-dependent alcohol dehydrogenase [Adhaeribacter pallidiroseus]RDC64707.1 putative cinnamyl alcohol dehydrogenase [Adhaeribacter pallidiroseus]
MMPTKGYAVQDATEPLGPFSFERREVGEHDVLISILYCGVCHSDVHQVRNEWGGSIYPMVPGHEIVGRISKVGSQVTKFKEGDLAGVGCFVDSCRTCHSCKEGLEQYCEVHTASTYNGLEMDRKTPTYGGYSNQIVVDENYTLKVSEKLDLSRVAPLLCAGITTYSPLRQWKVGAGHKLGVVGLGGLGHMAVKLGASMGAEVTVLSTSPSKEADAKELGAHKFAVTRNPEHLKEYTNYFDFILDTVSAPHDLNLYLSLLRRDGTMILVGAPPEPAPVAGFSLISRRKRLVGSMIGGIPETQEMLDYCAENNIMSDVEVIPMAQINEAYERMLRSDVKYRFVIDMATL